MSAPDPTPAQLIATLYDDPRKCAELAKLRYVSPDEPGMTRLRKGRGFSYRDSTGATIVDLSTRDRITKLAIPPAWRNVWINTDADGHLLAVGKDLKGRRQYIYHERWRSIRDQLNFYRLIGFGNALPTIRADVDQQLRRRTLDSARVLAAMLRIIDVAALRVGNEVYAEENESYGLSTLRRRHVRVHGDTIDFRFPAKSGKTAEVSVTDRGAARVVAELTTKRSKRLFTVGGEPVSSDVINARLAELTGVHLTAKDFRTWNGTKTAFGYLRAHLPADAKPDKQVIAALDVASHVLGNTRTVARAHYVHPGVLDAYTDGELERFVTSTEPAPVAGLEENEQLLLAFLSAELGQRAAELVAADPPADSSTADSPSVGSPSAGAPSADTTRT